VRIEVIRSGGFTGIERRAVLDTTGRPDAHLTPSQRQLIQAVLHEGA